MAMVTCHSLTLAELSYGRVQFSPAWTGIEPRHTASADNLSPATHQYCVNPDYLSRVNYLLYGDGLCGICESKRNGHARDHRSHQSCTRYTVLGCQGRAKEPLVQSDPFSTPSLQSGREGGKGARASVALLRVPDALAGWVSNDVLGDDLAPAMSFPSPAKPGGGVQTSAVISLRYLLIQSAIAPLLVMAFSIEDNAPRTPLGNRVWAVKQMASPQPIDVEASQRQSWCDPEKTQLLVYTSAGPGG
ncbi:hypothetical protein BJY52DRAFT_1221192 [Lactarius psammicola]|nr:hypothetical protein BJY52DRAFT_1221192 [Lactarius psammicola]